MRRSSKITRISRPMVALAAVIVTAGLVFGGTAVAQRLITGADIQNGSITTRDIRNNDLTTRDVRNGTLRRADLSPGLRAEIDAGGDEGAHRWVKVESNSPGVPTVQNQSHSPAEGGVTGATRRAAGLYEITFGSSVVDCGWMATVNDADFGAVSSYGIAVERESSGNVAGLLVRTFDSDGLLADLESDDGFVLQILC